MQSIAKRIQKEIERHEGGWCFSQKDFLGIAKRNSLEQAFFRLLKMGRFGALVGVFMMFHVTAIC